MHSGLKVRGCEINFIIKKLLKSKNPRGFVITVLKVLVILVVFDLSNFNLIVDFGASDFEAAVQLQIEVKQKMLG